MTTATSSAARIWAGIAGCLLVACMVIYVVPVSAAAQSPNGSAGGSGDESTTSAASGASAPAVAIAPSAPSASAIDAYLAEKGSPMVGQGGAFMASGAAWQIDPRLLVAIAGAESSFGSITCADHNAWGWGCPNNPYNFGTWAEGIDAVAKGLRENYLSEGRTTVAAIHAKYAPIGAANDPTGLNNAWTMNVSRFIVELGGDPLNIDIAGVGGTIFMGYDQDPAASAGMYGGVASADQPSEQDDEPATMVPGADDAELSINLTNSGFVEWRPGTVRLRRIDDEQRIASSAVAAFADDGTVKPGDQAILTAQIAVAATARGELTTRWRLEGPGGMFGDVIDVPVLVADESFAAGDGTIEGATRIGAGGSSRLIVRMRNDGSDIWRRDGDGAVWLGLVNQRGPDVAADSWPGDKIPSGLLERRVDPGETGTFAFVVTAAETPGTTRFSAIPFADGRWAAGEPLRFSVETTR